jgi:sugar/nucleoside kinase (ribokinase family)
MIKEISLYGNLILDTNYIVDQFPVNGASNECLKSFVSTGGIANVARGLRKQSVSNPIIINSCVGDDGPGKVIIEELIQLKSDIHFLEVKEDVKTSVATIISDIRNKTKTSIVDWQACCYFDRFVPNSNWWSHFAYIDKTEELTKWSLESFSHNITSADLCLSSNDRDNVERIFSLLPYLDFVVLSENEAKGISRQTSLVELAREIGRKAKGWAIIHHPEGSVSSNGEQLFSMDVEQIDNLNVLGAGDIFVSNLVYYKWKNGIESKMSKCVNWCHSETTKILKRLNNEQEI